MIASTSREEHVNWLGSLLLVCTVYEVGLMGSGRMLQAGPLTVRMWLFLVAMVYVTWTVFTARRLSWASVLVSTDLAVMLLFAFTISVSQNAKLDLVVEDIKPILYFFMLLFFETTIRTLHEVEKVILIIKRVGLALCAMYAIVFVLLLTKVVSFVALYAAAEIFQDELFFRGDSGMFLYKGSIYIGIAFFFFVFSESKRAKLGAIICVLGLVATGTRGFLASLVLTGVVYFLLSDIKPIRKVLLLATSILLAVIGFAVISNPEAQAASDHERIITFSQVMERVNPLSIFFGHGFGFGVPERPVHMESAFLEVFHKQGILGFGWWGVVFVLLFCRFRKASKTSERKIACAFLLSVLFVFVESWTNPWITNPIGMAALLLALASLKVIGHKGVNAKLDMTIPLMTGISPAGGDDVTEGRG